MTELLARRLQLLNVGLVVLLLRESLPAARQLPKLQGGGSGSGRPRYQPLGGGGHSGDEPGPPAAGRRSLAATVWRHYSAVRPPKTQTGDTSAQVCLYELV